MFRRNSLWISLLALGIILSAGATALADNNRTLNLPADVVLQGTRLQAGDYTVTWYHHSPRLTVKFSNARKAQVTASATMVKWSQSYDRDTIVVSKKADGTRVLRAIVFAGSSQAILFDAQRQSEKPWLLPYSSGGAGLAPGVTSNRARKQMAP